MMSRSLLFFLCCLMSFSACSQAANEAGLASASQLKTNELKQFASADMRQRYYALIAELRCPKCQNQNLADSDAPIAKDLRDELYLLINDDYSDAEILAFMASRYGEFVLYAPPVNKVTAVLWVIPAALGLLGLVIVGYVVMRSQQDDEVIND